VAPRVGRGLRGRPVLRVVSADWVVPVEGDPIRDGAVAIADDGTIAAVGERRELGDGEHYADAVILPGFVNAHTHLEYDVYAGFGDGLRFAEWIGLHVQRKSRLGLDEMEAIARLGALNCLRSGVTTVGDCSFSGAAATACADLGLRGTIYLEVFGTDASPIEERFGPMRERLAHLPSDTVRIGISPHAPYTCTIDLYRACADLGLPIATHLAESDDETEFLRSGGGGWQSFAEMLVPPLGTTGIRALAEAGLLDSNVVAAHCVKADDEEIALLAEHDVAVAHCPRSNGILGCGVAPLAALREAGVRVCLATDSPASTPSFDMFDEMRAAIVGARARERRPDALTATDALELATLGGARALGLEDRLGSLVPGKQADLAVLSLADTSFIPWEDPVTGAVLGGSARGVVATLVSGKPRYEKGGKTWLELIDAARSARSRLLQDAGPRS
jgi:cytosine/adenosine deaminase-related metal-dependent hydrolase